MSHGKHNILTNLITLYEHVLIFWINPEAEYTKLFFVKISIIYIYI